jgi:hypothetical protein
MYTNNMDRLFAEGGMNDEGGTVDPVSGNDVPPGSLQKEVRDDIDAKLSEGEFVIPADVVRYIGLERLMKLRDEAKQGLSRMNEIGQMGNAEEVSNPEALHNSEDDGGFTSEVDDIMEEVDMDSRGEKRFAGGGAVYVPPADKDILAKYNIQRTSITNPALDVRLLKNAAGDSLYMTYFNGKPGGTIPEGYSVVDSNPASRMSGATTTTTGSTVTQNVEGAASVDGGNKNITTVGGDTTVGNVGNVNNTSMTDLALGNVAITGKDGKVTTVGGGDTGTTTDGGLGVNAYGGNITSNADGGVSTGIGGFTLNPDGSVTANTLNKGLTATAGIVNPLLGVAARINNALASSSAKDFTRSIADTMGTNTDTSTAAATAGPTGTGSTAASAAADAASSATSMGLSPAAAGAASQAAANVITSGGTSSDAAEAGRSAAADVTRSEQSSTDTSATDKAAEDYRKSLDGFDVAGPSNTGGGFNLAGSFDFRGGGGGSGSGGKYFDDMGNATMAFAKGGLVTKRTKKPAPAQKRGIASKK